MNLKLFLAAAVSLLMPAVNGQAQEIKPGDKVLTAYYSRSGNTREIASQIHHAAGGDLVEIIPVEGYPDDYRQTTERAKKEISEGYEPELKTKVANIRDYDVVFIGSPCWWGTFASPVRRFLSENDLRGKTVILFMTHGGSGLGRSMDDLRKMLPDSNVIDGKAFWGSRAERAENDVNEWVKGLRNE